MSHSKKFYEKACQTLVGGVNSPVRSFNSVGGDPLFFDRGEGPYLFDVDGRRYIDFVLSWGPLILGHRSPAVVGALEEQMSRGWTFGAPVTKEIELAEEILKHQSFLEKIRFVSSGTEATMSALRLARGVTGREQVVKFAGCYHGHVDHLLVDAGSGLVTLGQPTSAGVPKSVAQSTHVLPFNDPGSLNQCLDQAGQDIAAVIVEPVAGNMGVIPPRKEFIEALNQVFRKSGALLIADEVLTGFRVGPGHACGRYQLAPDIVTFGKAVGGGLPVGAYAARAEIMEHISPLGPVYQAGTLSGNPLAMAAGVATLRELTPEIYKSFDTLGQRFSLSLGELFSKYDIPHVIHHVGSLLGFFLCSEPVNDFEAAKKTNQQMYQQLFHACLEEGIYLPPSPYEALFLSTAHTWDILEEALEAFDRALQKACSATAF